MKKYVFSLLLILISLLTGCGGDKKTQSEKKATEKLAMPLAQEKKDSTMLSFFDEDVNAFEDIETFVLDDELPKNDTVKVVQTENPNDMFELHEPQHIDQEKAIVYFDYDSNQIRDDQRAVVQSLKKQIKKWIRKGYKVVFRGHSCRYSPKGDSVYNMILSNDRAAFLADTLAVPQDKRTIVGLGYEEPLVIEPTRTKAGQAPNRRVEIYPITI